MVEIREIDIDELKQAFPVLHQLRPHLSLADCIAHITVMVPLGYKMLCIF